MTRLLLLLVLLAGGGLARAVQWKWEADLDSARATHRAQAHARSETVAERVRFTFTQLYRGLRTIARLPGVRRIGRHAEGFDGDARASVQELYNNLATTVAMSEVYIVPRSLDPEATDPVTGAPETPIATFDELIVGPAQGDDHERGEAVEVEEIEIHEYRLMREQLAHFATSAPRADGRVGFELPALCGREVVTCDNSRYRPDAPDDRDRSGLVYSVPFYGLDDTLAGCISGVLLTHALRDLLPDGNYAIRQGAYGYTAGSQAPGPWSEAAAAVAAGRADDARIYSEVLDLEVRDAGGPWLLWAGLPDEAFWNRADVRASRSAMVASATAVGVFELGGLLGVFLLARGRRQAQRRRAELEERVRGATARVAEAVATLRSSAAALAGESGQLAAANGQITASADAAARQADDVARDAVDVLAGVEGVATSIEELGRTAQGIARSVAESAGRAAVAAEHTTSVDRVVTELGQNVDDIRRLLDVIADIARQTNMLAINAAIEAARAGDSGRGFAVVASQVKDLAGRSAAAATRIHAGTDALGQLSARAVEAIGAIRGIVCAISEAQQGIAAAVEEQSAATDEIQQAASQASTAARSIASTIHDNAQSTAVTKREANGCTESVQRLAELATTVNDTLQRLAVD